MNAIRQTQQLNKRELENATPPSASWHADYRDTAWIYVGGLPLDLSEGDVVTVFSQFGNPTHLNLIRDRETGKSKGFGFLKYEDQRSCDLAVDNLTGADVLGRLLRVDHTRYKKKEDEDEDTYRIDRLEADAAAESKQHTNGKRASDTEESEDETKRRKKRRPLLKEEKELQEMLAIKEDGEEEDPMRDYLIREKREEVEEARRKEERRDRRHKHRRREYGDDRDYDKSRGHQRQDRSSDEQRRERREKNKYKDIDEDSGRDDDKKTRYHPSTRSEERDINSTLRRKDRSPPNSQSRRSHRDDRRDR